MRKRMNKLEVAKKDLPKGEVIGSKDAKIGIIGFGSTYGPIVESIQQLSEKGIVVKFHQIRTIWPLLVDDLQEFIEKTDVVFVIESNYQGQLATLIRGAIDDNAKIQSITKFDGSSFKPKEITSAISSFADQKVSV